MTGYERKAEVPGVALQRAENDPMKRTSHISAAIIHAHFVRMCSRAHTRRSSKQTLNEHCSGISQNKSGVTNQRRGNSGLDFFVQLGKLRPVQTLTVMMRSVITEITGQKVEEPVCVVV